MAVKTVYVCDVNTCEAETEDPCKIYVVRLIDKDYNVCEVCYKSLTEFIQKRMNEGQIPGTPNDLLEHLKKLGNQQPQTGGVIFPSDNQVTTIPIWSEPNTGYTIKYSNDPPVEIKLDDAVSNTTHTLCSEIQAMMK